MSRRSGSMSGEWKRSMVGYSGTGNRKSRPHARPHLNHRATPRLYHDQRYSFVPFANGRASGFLEEGIAFSRDGNTKTPAE